MPLLGTRGAASAQGFGEFAQSGPATYIEDVFSTYLYTGNGSTQTITNGIDLSGKGGLVWTKSRSAADDHKWYDTVRGATKYIMSSAANAEITAANSLTAFTTTGFTLGSGNEGNFNARTYVSWTFREQPKFFDVVTYTGNGVAGRTIAHNLGSAPGCVIVKCTSSAYYWPVYHRSITANGAMQLNNTAPSTSFAGQLYFGNDVNVVAPTSTVFTVGSDVNVNQNGQTYVAYLFAHNAGGFGASGNDNVISCGSFTQASAVDVNVNLGYEPQWLLIRSATKSNQWYVIDNMRGFLAGSNSTTSKTLYANLTNAEGDYGIQLTSTGFTYPSTQYSVSSSDIIYIAIRRGPMKTPTSGTSVYNALTYTGNGTSGRKLTTGNTVDLCWQTTRSGFYVCSYDRLRGSAKQLVCGQTAAEQGTSPLVGFDTNQGLIAYGGEDGSGGSFQSWFNEPSGNNVFWGIGRAPGFFDEVCYTGTGANTTQTHNLGVVPELIIVKRRGATSAWPVYSAVLANTEYLVLNTTAAKATGATYWNSTTPTSTVFSLGTAADVNASGSTGTYVAYLFASCPGVSKVGTYSGTGGTQTISCGFSARFVLIKRTDSTGDWWVWDTARGMVAGTDPRLAFNLTSAETNANWVYTDASGFQIVTTDASVNASGGTYIYLAIA